MKTKYFYIIGAAFAIAITAVVGFKHFMPSAISENTTLSALSEASNTVISTAETSAVKLSESTATELSSSKETSYEETTPTVTSSTEKEEKTTTKPFQITLPDIKLPTLPFPTTSTTKPPSDEDIDLSCFDNTAFVGNSRFISFKNFGFAKNVYPVVGLNVDTVFTKSVAGSSVPVIDELNGKEYDKVILLFGDNECGWPDTDVFIKRYAKVIAAVRERVPEAEIYLHAILPVSTEASEKNQFGVTNERIRQVNARIKQLAADEGIYFIEQPECLMTSDGVLIPEAASDGIHLNKKYSEIWIKHLAVTLF